MISEQVVSSLCSIRERTDSNDELQYRRKVGDDFDLREMRA